MNYETFCKWFEESLINNKFKTTFRYNNGQLEISFEDI